MKLKVLAGSSEDLSFFCYCKNSSEIPKKQEAHYANSPVFFFLLKGTQNTCEDQKTELGNSEVTGVAGNLSIEYICVMIVKTIAPCSSEIYICFLGVMKAGDTW